MLFFFFSYSLLHTIFIYTDVKAFIYFPFLATIKISSEVLAVRAETKQD